MTGIDWLRPGIHDAVSMADYQADPCREPSLSAGIAHKLLSRSPKHAWTTHPRLNPDYVREERGDFDFGTAAHSILLDGVDICQVVEGFDNWRTNAAKDLRDQARAEGLVPLLPKDYERMRQLTESVSDQLARLGLRPTPLCDGKSEQTLIWQEDGVWCRARLDWLHIDGLAVDDLKTTATSANPRDWSRNRLFADGKDIQCAFYLRGLRAITGVEDIDWRFIVVEVEPPYGLSVISLAPAALELANAKVTLAIRKFKQCLETGEWPGYPREVAYAEPPAWVEQLWLEAQDAEEVAA